MEVEELDRTEPLDFKISFHNGFGKQEVEMNRSDAKRLMKKLQAVFSR